MMAEEILILRAVEREEAAPLPDLPLGGGVGGVKHTFRVEHTQATSDEVVDIREDRDVLAAVDVVPLKLHQPVARNGSSDETARLEQWGLNAVGCHESTCSGIGSSIAVLDTGIDMNHEAFAHARDRIVQEDFTGDGNGDSDGHGTHCAGTMIGGRVAGCQIGVAPGVQKLLVGKVIGTRGSSSAILARAIDWAVGHGANILSMSLGMDFPAYVRQRVEAGFPADIATARALQSYRETLEFFAAIAQRTNLCGRPVLFVAAAGNSSRCDENAAYIVGVEPPAAATGFLSVGALGRRPGNRYAVADFSNGGPRVCGPGVDILSASAGTQSGLALMSGTSMATPHVAGVAALWFESLTQAIGPEGVTTQHFFDEVLASATRHDIDAPRKSDAGKGLVRAPIE